MQVDKPMEPMEPMENLLDAIAAGIPPRFDPYLTPPARQANRAARERRRGGPARVALAVPIAPKVPAAKVPADPMNTEEEEDFGPRP